MDPLTAFSLACGVIQVVDFSTKALMKCKEIYDYGSLSEYQDIENLTENLTNLPNDLILPSIGQTSRHALTPSDKRLVELAKDCSTTAQKLVAKLQALKIERSHKKREAVMKTVKALREKKEIQNIQKQLDGYKNALNTQILIGLRFVEQFIIICPTFSKFDE